jgi:hypothetical protein
MPKLIVIALLAAAIAAIVAVAAAANPRGSNGRIVFARFDPALGDDFIYTANPDGSQERQLLPTGAGGPRWSPDGSRVVVDPDVDNLSARIVNPDDGSYRDLPNPNPDLFAALHCNEPWSPDGERLTCEAFGNVPAGWRGGQGQSREFKTPRSSFGWVELSQGTATSARGAITIVTSAKRTPSVAAVVAGLRSRGHGATYGPVAPVTIADFAGRQFDGTVGGQGHVFVPFSPPRHVATLYADAFAFDPGEAFRIDVLDIRGKTVVVFMESAALPADRFPDFLTSADQILGSLRFPD